MNYWGGATPTSDPNSVTCGCYADRACADPEKRCNCDSNDIGVWRADEGYLTNKDDLPVTKFQAGDTGRSFAHLAFKLTPDISLLIPSL